MKLHSIVKKALMALTGLGLVGFLITHLTGNFLLYKGADKFDGYAHWLEENPALPLAEMGLLGLFLFHIFLALKLTLENNSARPQKYEVRKTAGQSSLASRTMIISGLAIFGFVVLHIWQFKFGRALPTDSLWQLVISEFQKPWVVGVYVVAMLLLGLHLSHGIASALQSLGLRDDSGRPRLKGLGPAIGWGMALLFALMPIWAFTAKPVKAQAYPPFKIDIKEDIKVKTSQAGTLPDNAAQTKLAGSAHAE